MDDYSTMILNALIQLQVTNGVCTTLKNDFYHNPNTEDGLLDLSDPDLASKVSESTIKLYQDVLTLVNPGEGQEAVVLLLLSFLANMIVIPELIYDRTKLNVRKMLIEAYKVTVDDIQYTFMYDPDNPDHYVYYVDDEITAVLAPYKDSRYKMVEATPLSTDLSNAEFVALEKKYPELTFTGNMETTLTDQLSSMYSNIK